MKAIIISLALMALSVVSFAQADPSINILTIPDTIRLNQVGIIDVDATNTAGSSIVPNSLEITISVGINAEITGLATGSSTNWTVFSRTTGPANTIKLQNTGGSLAAYTTDDIFLSVTALATSNATTITGNMVYIPVTNPIIGQPNSAQGNVSTSNDNSTTSLAVIPAAPLPIDLSSFTGSISNCEANLNWAVNPGKSYTSFTVEQSVDGKSYSAVSTIPATESRTTYTFTGKQSIARGFYRLKITDRSGNASYSNTVSLTADCMQSDAGLSPNPTRGSVRLTGLISGGRVRVYNQLGAVVITVPDSADPALVDLGNLPNGLYRVSWDTEAGVVTRSVTKL